MRASVFLRVPQPPPDLKPSGSSHQIKCKIDVIIDSESLKIKHLARRLLSARASSCLLMLRR